MLENTGLDRAAVPSKYTRINACPWYWSLVIYFCSGVLGLYTEGGNG